MSDDRRPTVVLHSISFDGGRSGYRVILCDDADIFGDQSDRVVETIVDDRDDLGDALLDLERRVNGWDRVETGDLGYLWRNRPDRISKGSRLFAGAIREDLDESSEKSHIDDAEPWVSADETAVYDHDMSEKSDSRDECGHLPEYRINGECLRCDQSFNTDEERDVERELVS